MNKVLIVGGGAAGLMAAITASRNGSSVTLVERNERLARKVMITGKGRCNVTNDTDINGLVGSVTGNGRFLYSAFSLFSAKDTMDFFKKCGVPLKVERGNRVFPKSDKSVDIVDCLVNTAKLCKVKIITDRITKLIVKDNKISGAVSENGNEYFADKIIVATGGLSYPLTGSTGDGYELAKSVGHKITELKPSLVALNANEGWCSEAQGLSLKNISISVYEQGKKKPIYTDFGELMFTHYGLSGPVILSASAYLNSPEQNKYSIVIDLKPALDEKKLNERILRDFSQNSNRDYINSLGELLPRKLIPIIVKLSGIKPSVKVNQITREQREKLVNVLKNLTLNITGFRPIEEAVITKGGIALGEINPKTMESKLIKGLYFAGEILDVDAFTGGFNLQIAFSTGYTAALSAAQSE